MPDSPPMIEILKPTGQPKAIEGKPLPGVADLKNKVVGMLDNSKPNFDLFLDRLETLLLDDYSVAKIIRRKKAGPSVSGGPFLDELGKDCDLVIAGVGD